MARLYDSFGDRLDLSNIAGFEAHDDHLVVRDTVWGSCGIGDQPGDEIFTELLDNPLVRRTMAIEQLSLDDATATVPNTTMFSRWEHIWGSVVFTRAMLMDQPIDAREKLILQLRTFVSDLGHTAFSHLGDWIFQQDGNENQHDIELPDLLETVGINKIFTDHDIDPNEVIFPNVEDWVENASPNLCVDRVDYGAREMRRWLNIGLSPWPEVLRKDGYRVIDGQIVMSSQEEALAFAKAYMLLATEHWGEPVHRLQLKLQEQLVKSVLTTPYLELLTTDPFDRGNYHPRLILYTSDGDIIRETTKKARSHPDIRGVMRDIAASKRRIFAEGRGGELDMFLLREDVDQYPDPLIHYGSEGMFGNRKTSLTPPFVSMLPVDSVQEVSDFEELDYSLDFFLPSLKPRQVDPLYVDKQGNVKRLSETSTVFAELASQQAAVQKQAYVGRIALQPQLVAAVRREISETDEAWSEALTWPVMPSDIFMRTLHHGVAVAAMYSMIDLKWNR